MSDETLPGALQRSQSVNFRTIALIIASALFMEQLDATVLATALPTMANTFGVSAPHMSIALTSYLVSLAVFIPASGKAADRFGGRTVFRAAIAIFTIGSIMCGQADSLPFFVFSRFLQGIGGAMMVPVGRLVLLRTVEKSELVSALAWMLVPALIGPILGPPVGGFIVTYLDWRWIFYINVPIGILGMVLTTMFIPDVKEERHGPFDVLGFVLSGLSLGFLLFGFELSSRGALSATLVGSIFLVGIISGALYILHARRAADPILDISLMRVPTFNLSVIGGSLSRITQGAQPFLLPLMMQLGFGLSAVQSGLVTFATAIGAMLMKVTATSILRRYGFRSALIVNGVVSSICYAICAGFRPDWPQWLIFAILILSGFFMSLQFTAYNAVAYADIPRERMSAATSFYSTFQQLTLSFGICAAALALQISGALFGHIEAQLSDFSIAFLVVTTVSLIGTPFNMRFPPNAGDDMTGHRVRPLVED